MKVVPMVLTPDGMGWGADTLGSLSVRTPRVTLIVNVAHQARHDVGIHAPRKVSQHSRRDHFGTRRKSSAGATLSMFCDYLS